MALFFKSKSRANFKEATSISKVNNLKNFIAKATGLIKGGSGGRDDLTSPEYDLEEIKQASESDSYIKMAFLKYSQLLFKAGYRLKSDNEAAKDYIATRFYVMSFATNKPIDILWQEIGDDLIKYSNAFLIKSRVPQIMNGVQARGAFDNPQPVGGYYRIDPTTIKINRDKFGTIKGYEQEVDGENKKFKTSEVIHFYLDKEAANAFGTPRVVAVLEDVKLLRSIEGNISSMIYRFAMPLFHWIIGLPQQGYEATDKEIDEAEDTINNMSLDGSIVTNEKTNIKVVGAEGSALSAEGYLKYFEQRVFSGLGVSETQMGRGGSKQDADSMEAQAHDTVKYIQKVFKIFIEYFVINELLMEGGFNPILNQEDRVTFEFNEINIETKIKVENHEMAKYQSNMITFEEMRRELGKMETVEEDRLYSNMITLKAEEELTKLKSDESIRVAQESAKLNNSNNDTEASNGGAKGINPKGNGTNKTIQPNKDIQSKNTPENQHGKTSVKVKESEHDLNINLTEKAKSKRIHKKNYSAIYNKYNILSNDIKENPNNMELLFRLGKENLMHECKLYIQQEAMQGVFDASKQIEKMNKKRLFKKTTTISQSLFEDMCKKSLTKLFKEIEKRTKDNKEPKNIENVFNTLEYRIRFMLEYVLPKAYWYSYLKAGESYGLKSATVQFNGSEDEKEHDKEIDLKAINLDEIPPYHPFCDCKVKFNKGGK